MNSLSTSYLSWAAKPGIDIPWQMATYRGGQPANFARHRCRADLPGFSLLS